MEERRRLTRKEAKARTRQALLEAAAEVFANEGFHGASIDTIAEAAGYTKGAVYAHFANKDDLYLALLDEHLSSEGPPAFALLESGADVDSIAREIEEALPQELENIRDWGRLTYEFILHAMRDETVRERLAVRFERACDEYAKCLGKRFAARGERPPADLRQRAVALMAFENGLSLLGLISPALVAGGVYSATLARLVD
jgi:AcrR family transcriptional regulator